MWGHVVWEEMKSWLEKILELQSLNLGSTLCPAANEQWAVVKVI